MTSSPSELQVVKLIAEGHTSRQIAELLFIGERTVEPHRESVLEKLDMRDRVELTRYAIRRGLIEPWRRAATLPDGSGPPFSAAPESATLEKSEPDRKDATMPEHAHPAAPEQTEHGFDEGAGRRPRPPATRRVGSFADGLAEHAPVERARRRFSRASSGSRTTRARRTSSGDSARDWT